MIAMVVVVLNEGGDGRLELTLQVAVLEQDPDLEGLMPVFDLAQRLRVIWSSTDMIHAVLVKVFGKVAGDITGAVVAEQPWLARKLLTRNTFPYP